MLTAIIAVSDISWNCKNIFREGKRVQKFSICSTQCIFLVYLSSFWQSIMPLQFVVTVKKEICMNCIVCFVKSS